MSAVQVNQNPTSQTVAQLLPKLHDADPDYRFMSLNDLCQVLTIAKPDFLHNDYNTAARAVDWILKTLDDQNGEVQNLAIKWYSVESWVEVRLLANISKSRSACNEDSNEHPAAFGREIIPPQHRELGRQFYSCDGSSNSSHNSTTTHERCCAYEGGYRILSGTQQSSDTQAPWTCGHKANIEDQYEASNRTSRHVGSGIE